MAKRPISDILRALDVVDQLERLALVHDELIKSLKDRVDMIEKRLDEGLPRP